MNKIVISGLLICLFAWLGCDDDGPTDPQINVHDTVFVQDTFIVHDTIVVTGPSLKGYYEGIYTYLEIHNGIDTVVDSSQSVTFVFTVNRFLMTKDAAIPDSLRVFCDVDGDYAFENGVQLTITDPNRSRGVCTEGQNPFGSFNLDQMADTTRMLHDSTDEDGIQHIRYIRMVSTCPPIIEPDPPSLAGNYEGIYSYQEIQNGADVIVDTSQSVTFIFSIDQYLMTKDAAIPDSLRVFCDVEGDYVLRNGIQLTITDPNRTRGVCTFGQNPFGSFGLDQSSDTLRMMHDSTDNDGIRHIRYIRMVSTD